MERSKQKKTPTHSNNNPFLQYIDQCEQNPQYFSKEMNLLIKKQKELLKKYDFLEDKGRECVEWIEKFCLLVDGENAGKPVKLLLWQKWFIYSIFCFYGYFDTEIFNENGEVEGIEKKYQRLINDVLLVVASGNAKTTLVAMINAYCLFSKQFNACKIFIGSNSYKQSRLCYDTTSKILFKNKTLRGHVQFRDSYGELEIKQNGAKLVAMSSDGSNLEGIIPTILVIDEIHEMKTSAYADNLRKSIKRDDFLVIETTTQGTVRGGYLDQRIEYAENTLNNNTEVVNDRKLFVIYKQDSIEEIIEAYERNDVRVFMKSNPSLSKAVSIPLLKDKVKDMMNDNKQKVTILTKNFNIPQNPISSYFSEKECRTKPFDESIFYGAPVFLGLDVAYTRNVENDLTCLEILTVNPNTNEEFCKDIYFLPKYWKHYVRDNEGKLTEIVEDMAIAKSKVDTNILYNKKHNMYGYKLYAERGDVVIIDEELVETLVSEFGEQARCECDGVTEDFIIYYIAHLELKYKWFICKFGLDPNKASRIQSFANANIAPMDGKPPVVQFRMENKAHSNPIMQSTKEIRARGLVYNNNKLTELHFAQTQTKEDSNGYIVFTNSFMARKDGVIANLSARSAYNVFTTNKFTGVNNLESLKGWWNGRTQKDIQNQALGKGTPAGNL